MNANESIETTPELWIAMHLHSKGFEMPQNRKYSPEPSAYLLRKALQTCHRSGSMQAIPSCYIYLFVYLNHLFIFIHCVFRVLSKLLIHLVPHPTFTY